jgi:thermostable 8-oxoguanine DNA glycosylase
MKIIWKLEADEIARLSSFVSARRDDFFVLSRIEKNVANPPTSVEIDRFWWVLVSCLLSSRQRSGPDSYVSRFLATKPFPLAYEFYQQQADPLAAGKRVLKAAGGIRFPNRIAEYLSKNYTKLSGGHWTQTKAILERLIGQDSPKLEREAAEFVRVHFIGLGPKQSRNLLQVLGLTKYEIPIDSRIIKWLNAFGFPVELSATGLSDSHYYNFVSDGIQAMCEQSGILPCVFDAAVFSSYDEGWTEENLVW